jgi:hypothetical protein
VLTRMSTRFVTPIHFHLRVVLMSLQKFEFTPEGVSKRAVATVEFYKDIPNVRSPINRAFQQLI